MVIGFKKVEDNASAKYPPIHVAPLHLPSICSVIAVSQHSTASKMSRMGQRQ